MKRIATLFILSALLCSAQGCAYLQNRGDDAKDLIDLGFTFSKKAQISVFFDAPFVTIWPIGYGEVDGQFLGLGQGHLRAADPFYQKNYGVVLWGRERLSYNASLAELEEMNEEELDKNQELYGTGFLGFVEGPMPPPKYLGSCPHYIHVGWFGIVANPRYWEMIDFAAG